MRLKTRHDSTRIWLAAIIALHLALGLVYWNCTPYGVTPDEAYHGVYVTQLAEEHRLPVFSADDMENYEAHQPPLYYLLGVPFYLAAGGAGVRALSLVLGALSILTVYAAVKALIPERESTALACAGFVALLPMHLALSSSVGNDILTELIFGLAILLLVRLNRELNLKSSALLGLVLGLGLLTKTTCVLIFPVAVLAYVLMRRRGAVTPMEASAHVAVMIGIGLVVGGWWLVRNVSLYGDPFALTQFNQAFAHTPKPDYFLVERGLSVTDYIALVGGWTFASFWGVFGHMKVFMPTWTYLALAAVTLVALVGSIRPFITLNRESTERRHALIVMAALAVLVLLSFIRFNLTYFQAQGRYLYPAIIPISLAMVIGIERLLPEGNRRWSAVVVNGGMLLLTLTALVTAVIPNLPYQQP